MRRSSSRLANYRWLSASLAFLLAWLQVVPPALAGTFRVFEKTYVRDADAPDTVTHPFTVLNPTTTWTLRAVNGSLEDSSVERVSSSTLQLNGVEILQTSQFNQNVNLIEVPVAVQNSNTVATQLRSRPGGQLTVEIVGEDETSPTATWLAPSASLLTNAEQVAARLELRDDIAGLDPASLHLLLDGVSVRPAFSALSQPVLQALLDGTLPIEEGVHTLQADVQDLAGLSGGAAVQFTVDRTPPSIGDLTPADGATVDDPMPAIGAAIADSLSGVDVASIRLFLDGVDVTAAASVGSEGVAFTPAEPLADGHHAIRLELRDRTGNSADADWGFQVLTVVTPPITPSSGFIHGLVFHGITGQPLPGASVTTEGVVGEVRADAEGRYQFPAPGTGVFDLNIQQPGYTSVQRRAEVLAGRDAAVAPAFLTPLDSRVTPISPEAGGLAMDSSGNFQVEFPPGAAPRELPVTITPLANERQLPGPLNEDEGHIAAVYFEPRFTAFNTPATLRVRNTLGLPQGTMVNLQLWHEDEQRWQDVNPGHVTADGQWIEFRIIRFFCWYCIWLNRVLPPRSEGPREPTPTTTEAQDPGKGCDIRDQSAVCLASGNLSESHALSSLRTLGTPRTLTFTYRSSTASPSVLLGTDYALDPFRDSPTQPIPIPVTTTAAIQIEGRLISATFEGASGPVRQAVLWDGRNARGELVPTGAYPYTVSLSNDYDATLGGTGISAPDRSNLTTPVQSRAILVNERASAFGAGWNLGGLERLYPQPDGTILLTDGDGSATVFRPGPQVDLAVVSAQRISSTDDVSVLSGHGDGTFQLPQLFAMGLINNSETPSWVASGDFNEDGFQDLAVTLTVPGVVAVLFGLGRTTFTAPQRIAVDPTLVLLDVTDFNRDGHEDLAIVSQSVNSVAILLGRGDGTFHPKRVMATGPAPATLAIGDVTGDGILDLVVGSAGSVNEGAQTAAVLIGVGDGTFQPAPSPLIGRTPMAVVLGDFNADTFADLVVSNRVDGFLSLLLGRGDGTFQAAQPVPVSGHTPGALAAHDVNRDGRPDLAVADFGRHTVTILLNTGPVSFQQLPDLLTGQGPIALVIGDVNQDNIEDLAVTNSIAGSISFLAGHGDGTFARHREFPVGFQPVSLVLGEFDDRQGDPDQVFSGLPGEFSQVRKHPDGTYTRQLTNGTQLAFTAQGFHTRTTDRNGNATRYTYDAQNRLIRVEVPGGAAFDLRYSGASGPLTAITDSIGRTTQIVVDNAGNLRRITNPDTTTRDFVYDAEHRMTSQTNERGLATDYVYDAFGRVQEALLPERPLFDAATGTTMLQREVRRFTPSETQGLINALPSGVGTPDNPAPPVRPQLSTFQDSLGNTTQIATDRFGAPTKLIDALGRTTLIQRDVNGLPVRITQPDGARTTMLYDSRGNLIVHLHRLIDPRSTASFAPLITRFAYDARFSQVTEITDGRRDSLFDPVHPCPNGCVTTLDYDPQGNLTAVADGEGNITSFAYDSRGLLLAITDALGNLTPAVPDDHQMHFAYDPVTGNLLSTTDPLGRVTTLAYDAAGNVTQSLDAALRDTMFEYDVMNRLASVTDASGGLTAYQYDAAGNLTRASDAALRATAFTYDALNQLVRTENPLGQAKAFFYDANRNLARVLDPKGQTIDFRYDAANQLIEKTLLDAGSTVQDTVTYDYDLLGNIALVQDADSKLTFGYDSAGRLIQADSGDASNPALPHVRSTASFTYNGAGNRQGAGVFAQGLGSSSGGPGFLYSYDGANRLIGMHSQSISGANFEYDPLGRLVRVQPGAEARYAYDDASQLLSVQQRISSSMPPVATFDYAYDLAGNRTTLTDRLGLHSYSYDPLNRLTSADHPLVESPHPLAGRLPDEQFSYDAVGNRLTSHLSASHLYNAANRLLLDDDFRYAYDANGNLVEKRPVACDPAPAPCAGATTYTYDVENQLTQVTLPTGQVASFRYDGLGRRTEKAVDGAATRYAYEGEDIWVQVNGTTNCATHWFSHGPGIDEPLGLLMDQEGDCNFSTAAGFIEPAVALLSDGLGSVTTLINQTRLFFRSSFLAERVTYDSFGLPTFTHPGSDATMDTPDDVTSDRSAFGHPYAFTGREWDAETGLYYYRARYYDPKLGRFLQEDTFPRFREDSQSFNRYSYVYNNPINVTDPSGHLALVGTGIGILEVLLVLVAAAAAHHLSRQHPLSFCPISFRRAESSEATEPGTEIGRKWKDLNDNPQDWEKVEEKPDPRQPKGGSSTREIWKNKKTGEKIGVHSKDPPVPGGKQHPHPFPVKD